jgi:hypothetical protein
VRLDGVDQLEKSNDLIENRTRDLPACSIVPQPEYELKLRTGYRSVFDLLSALDIEEPKQVKGILVRTINFPIWSMDLFRANVYLYTELEKDLILRVVC